MKTGFKEPTAPKVKEKSMKSPWDFSAPAYDDRTKICAGTDYGVGYNAKIGSIGNPKSDDVIPKGRINTLDVDYK